MAYLRRIGVPTAVLVGLTFLLVLRLALGVITPTSDAADARHYVSAGMMLATEGVFGYGSEPGMYREPLTSWTIAAQAWLDPRLRGLTFDDIDRDGPAARAVKQQNLVWAGLVLLGVGQLTLLLLGAKGRRETLLAVSAMLVTHAAFLEWEDVTDRSLSELAAAAILVWATILAVRVVDRPRLRTWLALGALLGLLSLTKASFLYVAIAFLPMLALMRWWRASAPTGTVLRDLGVALVGLALICTPWMGRNLHLFGTFGISDRGGLAIWFRVNYNDVSAHELRGAWVYFSPLPLQPAAARLLDVDLEDFEGDGSLRRVARFAGGDDPEGLSFYRLARRDRVAAMAVHLEQGLSPEQAAHQADRDLMSWGVRALRDDPTRFLRTFPVFLWRGTWSMLFSNLVPSILLGPLNLAGMALLMVALALSVVRLRPRWFATVGIAGGIVTFYALLSHFEPRQSRPAVPIMLLLCVLAVDALLNAVRSRRTATTARRTGLSRESLD